MIETKEREDAIVVGLISRSKQQHDAVGATSGKRRREIADDNLDELVLLTDTAGGEVRHKIAQERDRIDPATFIGSGKVKEIARLVKEEKIDFVVFDDDLTPVQIRNLEKEIECNPATAASRSAS